MENYIKDLDLDEKIEKVTDYNGADLLPMASLIIVTYNLKKKLLEQCLNSLKKQTSNDFEILIVDNNDKVDIKPIVSKYILKHIKLNKNYGLSLGRNVGIKFAKGKIVIFLDDDATTHPDFVKINIEAHEKLNIIGLRGRIIPKSQVIYNELQVHYDLGIDIKPSMALGGVSSFNREALVEIGGFNPELFGHEDGEISYRLVKKYGRDKIIYHPDIIIYHDLSNNLKKYLSKEFRHSIMADKLREIHPEISKFFKTYRVPKNQQIKSKYSRIHRVKIGIILRLVHLIIKIARYLRKIKALK